jgi:hypothetical protein
MEARVGLESWWTVRFSGASRADRQRGIWLRGKLTVDPSMAELDYHRLVLEFPGGAYSDDALFRLALSAEERGDLREAQKLFEELLEDYSVSPRAGEARVWLNSHREQIAALPQEEDPEAERPVPEGTRPLETGSFSVQVGAFRSLDRARALVDQMEEAGMDPRIVRTPGNDLARVRLGRFESRDRAEALAREVERRGFEVTIATDASLEERVGNTSGAG